MLLSLVAKQTEKCKDCLAFAVENGYIDLEYKAEKDKLTYTGKTGVDSDDYKREKAAIKKINDDNKLFEEIQESKVTEIVSNDKQSCTNHF